MPLTGKFISSVKEITVYGDTDVVASKPRVLAMWAQGCDTSYTCQSWKHIKSGDETTSLSW